MGCDPSILTGSVAIPQGRPLFEDVWEAAIPAGHGLNVLTMMDAAADGRLKGLYVVGYDAYLSLAHEAATRHALERLEFVVVQDLFLNETARTFGHVFLPAASSFEKDGTFMNSERRIQRVRAVVPPRGEARPDWRIVCDVAAAMGHGRGFALKSAGEIWEEIRRVWPDGAGVTYARLEQGGLQWPCRDEGDPGLRVLHVEAFARGSTAALRCIDYRPTEERVTLEFPFLLTTGRTLYQFNAATMSGRSASGALRPTDTLDIAPQDARQLGVTDGVEVRIRSRWGEAILPARVTDAVKPGELFASFHDPARFLNRLTGPHRDAIVLAPEYKVTAVTIFPDGWLGSRASPLTI
jgi:formate dehydrogenase major subunit